MNFELLNKMVNYIEDHLEEDIDYKKLAKIVGISVYSLQRIFMFLANMSLAEYIRKRRLSMAYEELKTTDIKIIDLAIKYNYDSSMSFSRAFKGYFKMTPSECRNSNKEFKLFPVIEFKNDNSYNEKKYEIKNVDEKVLYCYSVSDSSHQDLLYKIRKLYKKIESNGIREKLAEVGMYGISYCNDEGYTYYVGSTLNLPNTSKVILEKGKYAVFEVGTEEQDDIVDMYDFVYSSFLKSTGYVLDDSPDIEYYENNNCYIYFKVKDKHN